MSRPPFLGPLLALAFVLAGCGAIPAYVPDLRRDSAPVAMDSPHGPMSPARARAVLDTLRARSPETDVLGRHLAIEQAITGTPLTIGNRVALLENGPATYEAMLAAIAQAKATIDLETYILDDDEVGRRFAQALVERAKAGVQVNMLRDGVGTLRTPESFFRSLSDGGVRVVEFNPVNPLKAKAGWDLNHRDHRKLLLVDARIAFLGGINISGVYQSSAGSSGSGSGGSSSGGAWRDTDVRVEGPAVADLQRLFVESWTAQHGPALGDRPPPTATAAAGKSIVRAVGSAPGDPYSVMFSALLSAIGSAESSIHLTNAYFVPDPQLLQALQDAARRGVDVSLVLPGRTDSWLVFHAGRGYYEPLLEAGVKIHERRGPMLHSKNAVIDGVWATVGSTNLDWRSFLHNQEVNVIVLGPDFAGQLEALFQRDLASSEEITLEAWRHRGARERAAEAFARAWEYWL